MEIKQKLDDNQRSVADNEKRLLHWQDKHSHLKLHRLESDNDDDSDSEAATEEGDADRTINAGEDTATVGSKAKQRGGSKETVASDATSCDDEEEEDDDGPLTLQEFPVDELRAIDKETIKAEIVVYEGE